MLDPKLPIIIANLEAKLGTQGNCLKQEMNSLTTEIDSLNIDHNSLKEEQEFLSEEKVQTDLMVNTLKNNHIISLSNNQSLLKNTSDINVNRILEIENKINTVEGALENNSRKNSNKNNRQNSRKKQSLL